MRYAVMVLCLWLMMIGLGGCGRTASFSYVKDASTEVSGEAQEDMSMEGAVFLQEPEDGSTPYCIYVDVCGEVVNPGVYELADGARVCDAVAAAGGFTKAAARESVNQARLLCDGEQLIVPSLEEIKARESFKEEDNASDGLVDINTADEGQLMELPGIGEAKAADIISYRTEHGRFQRVEDLMQVPGIKEGLYQKLKDKIKV